MKNIKDIAIILSLFGCLNVQAMKRFARPFAKVMGTATISTKTACQTLCIQPGASKQEIKAAYRKMALQAHPDQGGSNEAFRKVNEAYECLINTQPSYSNSYDDTNYSTQQTQAEQDKQWKQEMHEQHEKYKKQQEEDRLKNEAERQAQKEARDEEWINFWHKLFPSKTKKWIREKYKAGFDFNEYLKQESERTRVEEERKFAEEHAAYEQKKKQYEEEYKLQEKLREKSFKESLEKDLLKNTTLHLGKTWKWFQLQPVNANEVWKAAQNFHTQNIKPETHTYECSDDGNFWKIIFKKK